jgi:hypothetical protein
MAVVFSNYVVGTLNSGTTKDAVLINQSGGQDFVILRESLMAADIKILDEISVKAVSGVETPTMLQRIQASTVNGRPAIQLFQSRIVGINSVRAKVMRKEVSDDLEGAVVDTINTLGQLAEMVAQQ